MQIDTEPPNGETKAPPKCNAESPHILGEEQQAKTEATNEQVARKGNHNRSTFDNNIVGSDQQSAETLQKKITDDLRRQLEILRTLQEINEHKTQK